MRLDGKVIVVTGASGGIGWATCRRLAAEGASVLALSRTRPVDTVGSDDGITTGKGQARFVQTDVADQAAVAPAVRKALQLHRRIDGLFVNAGVLHAGTALDTSEHDWADSLEVNLTAVWRTVRAVVPAMLAHGSGGSVVVNSSVQGSRGIAGFAAYTASKFGAVGLVQTLAQELGPHSIRVNSVLPTSVNTPMINGAEHRHRMTKGSGSAAEQQALYRAGHLMPVGWIEPEDVANAVLWLLSDESRFVTGVNLPVDPATSPRRSPPERQPRRASSRAGRGCASSARAAG